MCLKVIVPLWQHKWRILSPAARKQKAEAQKSALSYIGNAAPEKTRNPTLAIPLHNDPRLKREGMGSL